MSPHLPISEDGYRREGNGVACSGWTYNVDMVPLRSNRPGYLDMPPPLVLLAGIAVPVCLLILSLQDMLPPFPGMTLMAVYIVAFMSLRRWSVRHQQERRLQRMASLR